MNELRARVDPASLEVTSLGSVAGRVWLEAPGLSFPEQGWFDFPLVVLSWWAEQLSSGSNEAVLQFMDGPFEVRIVMESAACTALFMRNGSTFHVLRDVDTDALIRSIDEAIRALMTTCSKRGIDSEHLQMLSSRHGAAGRSDTGLVE